MSSSRGTCRSTAEITGVSANSETGWIGKNEPERRLVWPVAAMRADGRQGRARRAGKRTYNTRLIKRDYAYFISEIADLFHLHPNAVRRWIKAGLFTVDDRRPALIHGGDLIDFLDTRQAQRKQKCAIDEFYCCRCRRPRRPLFNRVQVQIRKAKINLSGVCDTCGSRMNSVGSVSGIEDYRRTFMIQTPGEGLLSGRSDPIVMCHLDKDNTHADLQPEK
jgi:hypothetical protein